MGRQGRGSTRRAERWWAKFAADRAQEYAKDPAKALRLVEDVFQKSRRMTPRGSIRSVWEDLQGLARLARAWASGEYREVPWQTVVLCIGAAFYFFLPADAIPDPIPIVGFGDDAAVIAWVLASIREDLDGFKAWEKPR